MLCCTAWHILYTLSCQLVRAWTFSINTDSLIHPSKAVSLSKIARWLERFSLVQLAILLVKLNLLRHISPVDQDFVSAIAHLQGKAVVPEAMSIDISESLITAVSKHFCKDAVYLCWLLSNLTCAEEKLFLFGHCSLVGKIFVGVTRHPPGEAEPSPAHLASRSRLRQCNCASSR